MRLSLAVAATLSAVLAGRAPIVPKNATGSNVTLPAPALATPRLAGPRTLVFDGVTVIDVKTGRRIPDQRVVIVGTRIRTVGVAATVRVPSGAQVVDAHGKYLIPGLWDMHTHAGRSTEVFYPLLLANGITGFRDAGSMVPLDTLRLWRREILAGTRVGPPRQLFSGVYPRECDQSELRGSYKGCAADSADAVHYVDSLKAAGADMLRLREVYPPMYFILAAEARRVGLPFGGQAWDNIAIMGSDSGASIIDHSTPWGGDVQILKGLRWRCWAGDWPGRESVSTTQCRPVVKQFKRNHTWVVPTVVVNRLLGHDKSAMATRHATAILRRFVSGSKEFWGGTPLSGNWLRDSTRSDATTAAGVTDTLGVLRIMQATGFPIMAGSSVSEDSIRRMPPGFVLHTELAVDVAEGLTPLTALQSATLNPATFLRATDSLGTVAPGKLADLVLLDADPLVDITNTTTIRAVVANGRYFDRAALDQLVATARAKVK